MASWAGSIAEQFGAQPRSAMPISGQARPLRDAGRSLALPSVDHPCHAAAPTIADPGRSGISADPAYQPIPTTCRFTVTGAAGSADYDAVRSPLEANACRLTPKPIPGRLARHRATPGDPPTTDADPDRPAGSPQSVGNPDSPTTDAGAVRREAESDRGRFTRGRFTLRRSRATGHRSDPPPTNAIR